MFSIMANSIFLQRYNKIWISWRNPATFSPRMRFFYALGEILLLFRQEGDFFTFLAKSCVVFKSLQAPTSVAEGIASGSLKAIFK